MHLENIKSGGDKFYDSFEKISATMCNFDTNGPYNSETEDFHTKEILIFHSSPSVSVLYVGTTQNNPQYLPQEKVQKINKNMTSQVFFIIILFM